MATEWHYSKGNQQHGPVSAAELKQMAQSGQIAPDDLVWKEGMKNWKPASSIKGLFPASGVGTPSSPPPISTPLENDPQEIVQNLRNKLVHVWRTNKFAFFGYGFGALTVFICGINGALMGTTYDGPPGFWSNIGMMLALLVMLVWFGFFVGFVVTGFMKFNRKMNRDTIYSQWNPIDGDGPWLEFHRDGSLTDANGYAGSFSFNQDDTLDVTDDDGSVRTWKVVSIGGLEMVIKDEQGKVTRYKPKNSFSASRRQGLLCRKWEPVDGEGPAIQFNKDGAVIQFGGFVGHYELNGESPREVVKIMLDNGTAFTLKVISLSRHELVLSGEGGSKHYRRGVSVSDEEVQKEIENVKQKAKAVGKAAVVTVGAVGVGLLALGAVAAASGTTSGGGRGALGETPYKAPCHRCQKLIAYAASVCPYCGYEK